MSRKVIPPTPIRPEPQGKRGKLARQAQRGKQAEWDRIAKASPCYEGDRPLSANTLVALKRHDVSVAALCAVPQITPLLKVADGGMKTIYSAMRMAQNDQVIAAYLAKYDSLSLHDRNCLPMEAVCIAGGVNVTSLLGAILIALDRQAISVVRIMAVTSHPKIVAARIKYGQLPMGDRDRQALDQATGFLPSPKGATFIGKAIYNSGKGVMDLQRLDEGPDDDDDPLDPDGYPVAAPIDLDKLFPSARETQEELIPIRNRLTATSGPDSDPARPKPPGYKN